MACQVPGDHVHVPTYTAAVKVLGTAKDKNPLSQFSVGLEVADPLDPRKLMSNSVIEPFICGPEVAAGKLSQGYVRRVIRSRAIKLFRQLPSKRKDSTPCREPDRNSQKLGKGFIAEGWANCLQIDKATEHRCYFKAE